MSIYRDTNPEDFDAAMESDEYYAEWATFLDTSCQPDPWEDLVSPFDPDTMPFGTDFSSEPPF